MYATMKNLKKYHGKVPGLIMYSPYTGEEYSATPGDYFWAKPNDRFRDSTGHVMRLVRVYYSKKYPHSRIERRIEFL